jgi:hypothetical protein
MDGVIVILIMFFFRLVLPIALLFLLSLWAERSGIASRLR